MTEFSQPWDGTMLGHATRAPYSADEWDDMYATLFGSAENCGVIPGFLDELEVQGSDPCVGGNARVIVEDGYAMVLGKWYYNDDEELTILVPLAAAGWREDCIVIRCNWTTQTITAERHENDAENVAWDNDDLTQFDGDVYEIPLAAVRVGDDCGDGMDGILSVTDLRQEIYGPETELFFGIGDLEVPGGVGAGGEEFFGVGDLENSGISAWSAAEMYWSFADIGGGIVCSTWRIPSNYLGNQFDVKIFCKNVTGFPGAGNWQWTVSMAFNVHGQLLPLTAAYDVVWQWNAAMPGVTDQLVVTDGVLDSGNPLVDAKPGDFVVIAISGQAVTASNVGLIGMSIEWE